MTLQIVLAGAFAGFLVIFWLTPVGVPALRKIAGGASPPDLELGYNPETFYRTIERFGPLGVAHWRRLLVLDLVFPAVYAALFALLLSRWADWAEAGVVWRTTGIALPIAAAGCDYLENLTLLRVLSHLPRKAPSLVSAASAFTRGKFVFSWLTPALPVVFFVSALFSK